MDILVTMESLKNCFFSRSLKAGNTQEMFSVSFLSLPSPLPPEHESFYAVIHWKLLLPCWIQKENVIAFSIHWWWWEKPRYIFYINVKAFLQKRQYAIHWNYSCVKPGSLQCKWHLLRAHTERKADKQKLSPRTSAHHGKHSFAV